MESRAKIHAKYKSRSLTWILFFLIRHSRKQYFGITVIITVKKKQPQRATKFHLAKCRVIGQKQ